jgi:hypothetical protein
MNLAKITVVYRLIPSRATSVECVLKSSRAREVPVLGLLLARAKKYPGYSIFHNGPFQLSATIWNSWNRIATPARSE